MTIEKRLKLTMILLWILLSPLLTYADSEPVIIKVTDSLGHTQTNSWAKGTGGDWSTGIFAYTVAIGDSITFEAYASEPNVEYAFWVQPPGGVFVLMQDWSTNNKWTWFVDARFFGKWSTVVVGIRDGDDLNVFGFCDDYTYLNYEVASMRDFTLTVDRQSIDLVIGEQPQYVKFTVKSIGGFTATMNLSVTNTPNGVLAKLDKTTFSIGVGDEVTGTLSVYASWNSVPRNYTIKLKGVGDGREHTVDLNLNIMIPPPSFNLTVQPKEFTLLQVEGYNVSSTLTVESRTNYSITVSLEAQEVPKGVSVTLGSKELRCGRMGLNFTDLIFTIDGKDLPAEGNYTVSILGVAGIRQAKTTVILQIMKKIPSVITTSVSATNIEYGQSLKLEGVISPPQKGEVITYLIFENGSKVVIGKIHSDDQGKYSYSFTPKSVGSFTLAASWEGNRLYLGASSKPLNIIVERAMTELSLELNASRISLGKTVLAKGELIAKDGRSLSVTPVTLTVKFGENSFFLKVLTDQSGGYSVVLPFLGNGTYSLVANFDGNEYYIPSSSNEITLIVAKPSELILTLDKLVFTTVGVAVGLILGFLVKKKYKYAKSEEAIEPSLKIANTLSEHQSSEDNITSSITTSSKDKISSVIDESVNDANNLKSDDHESTRKYSVGPVLITFSGGYEDKNSPIFFIPNGHIKITAHLTPIEGEACETYGFYISIYKIDKHTDLVWSGETEHIGTYETYVYSLEAGDYFLAVSSINLKWQVTVQVYG